jgi:cyclophilin family peptidyl-prolyl cis-trans isomerase
VTRLRIALALALWLGSCGAPTPKGPVATLRVKGYGEIRFELLLDKAPRHVASFMSLANVGFYDGTTFHRVIPKFMIQGGDPNSKDADPRNDGTGSPGYHLKSEFNDVPHKPGIVSMARASDPDSAGCQFFIMTTGSESWQSQLDGQFTVFGRVLSGQDVVDKISQAPRDSHDRPLENVVIESVTVTDH